MQTSTVVVVALVSLVLVVFLAIGLDRMTAQLHRANVKIQALEKHNEPQCFGRKVPDGRNPSRGWDI